MRITKRAAFLATGAAAALVTLGAVPAQAADGDATLSVLHGVPDLTVDVWVNDELTLDAGKSYTAAAHLDAVGRPGRHDRSRGRVRLGCQPARRRRRSAPPRRRRGCARAPLLRRDRPRPALTGRTTAPPPTRRGEHVTVTARADDDALRALGVAFAGGDETSPRSTSTAIRRTRATRSSAAPSSPARPEREVAPPTRRRPPHAPTPRGTPYFGAHGEGPSGRDRQAVIGTLYESSAAAPSSARSSVVTVAFRRFGNTCR